MTDEPAAEALLLTGVYGSGKSTLCGLIGEELEARGLRFAAIDLDWLGWSNVAPEGAMLALNLASIAANYRCRRSLLRPLAHRTPPRAARRAESRPWRSIASRTARGAG